MVNGSNQPSWKGVNENDTFDDLVKEIYEFNYNDTYWYYDDDIDLKEVKTKQIYIPPIGFCSHLAHYNVSRKLVLVYRKRSFKLMLIDPNVMEDIRILEQPDAFLDLTVGETKGNKLALYKVHSEVHDSRFYC